MGLLAKVSGFAWGLETGVMRMTAEALIASFPRYALAITGSMAYEQSLKRLDTIVVNATARRVLGTGVSARLLTLRKSA